MEKKGIPYEGIIHSDYKKKSLLKLNVFLALFLVPIILTILSGYFELNQAPPRREEGLVELSNLSGEDRLWLLIFALLCIVVVPYSVVSIIYYSYLSAFVRNFTYTISEDHIIVELGVFSKTKVTIPYTRIQSINVVSGFFDRLFKTYTIKVATRFQTLGRIPGLKEPQIIEEKINAMVRKYSQIPGGLDENIFKPEDLAFDNFISYILSKMREGESLKTNVKELREKKNITSAELAEKVGVPIHTIYYLEEGKYNPSLTLAYKIAVALDCKIEDLFQLSS